MLIVKLLFCSMPIFQLLFRRLLKDCRPFITIFVQQNLKKVKGNTETLFFPENALARRADFHGAKLTGLTEEWLGI